jgi:hypothetical protein
MVKDTVRAALRRLCGFLEYRKAHVQLVILPDIGDGKTGLDDYLAGGGTVDALEQDGRIIAPAELAEFTRTAATPKPQPLPPAKPCGLADVEQTFARWLQDDDPVPTRAVLAAYVANRKLDGDPVWLMLVGGSGIGKTERLIPVSVMPDVAMVSSISGEAALLSGTKTADRAKDATGGLLRRIPANGGVLVLKDFTSILSMQRDARNAVLGALREIHDGRWDREVGADGGRILTWTGRLGLLAGCTTAIDSAHGVMSTMGTRFVLVRLTGEPDSRAGLAAAALAHTGTETPMRTELRDAVRGLLENLHGEPHPLDADVRGHLVALAQLVSLARSPVDRDRDNHGEISLVLDPEAPTRVVKMLGQMWCACGLLKLNRVESWDVVRRVGLDSIPKLRRAVILHLAEPGSEPTTTTAVGEGVDHPTRTTRRALEDLTAHGVVVRYAGGEGKADLWQLSADAKGWLATVETLPTMSEETHEGTNEAPIDRQNDASNSPLSTDDDIVGKVAEQAAAADYCPRCGLDYLPDGTCPRCDGVTA